MPSPAARPWGIYYFQPASFNRSACSKSCYKYEYEYLRWVYGLVLIAEAFCRVEYTCHIILDWILVLYMIWYSPRTAPCNRDTKITFPSFCASMRTMFLLKRRASSLKNPLFRYNRPYIICSTRTAVTYFFLYDNQTTSVVVDWRPQLIYRLQGGMRFTATNIKKKK